MEVETQNYLKYEYFKISSNRVQFYVKMKSTAHICLSTVAHIDQPFIEFVIEFKENISHLRLRNGTKYILQNSDEVRKNLLSESEYRGFWIQFNEGNYSLGCDGETVPLLEWKDPEPFEINYVGVASNNHKGLWKIRLDNFNYPTWIPANNTYKPSGAVGTGQIKNGPHYIARVRHDLSKSLIPARLIKNYKCLYGYLGVEYEAKEYEVLCGGSGHWVKVTDGKIPTNAFDCTDASTKNKYFIGRAPLDDWILCGKVYQHDGLCLVAYNGKEHIFGDYEIFVI